MQLGHCDAAAAAVSDVGAIYYTFDDLHANRNMDSSNVKAIAFAQAAEYYTILLLQVYQKSSMIDAILTRTTIIVVRRRDRVYTQSGQM